MKQNSAAGSLKQWYLNYINCFREEWKKLSADERKGMNNTNNFLDPCQVEIFWVTDPDYQLIVQSNFNDMPDKDIIVNGPYKLHEFHSNVVTVLTNERWSRSLAQKSMQGHRQINTLGEAMATMVYSFVEVIRNDFFQIPLSSNSMRMGMMIENTWACVYKGNMGNLNHTKNINDLIQEIIRDAKAKQEQKMVPQQHKQFNDEKYAGFGIHFFPPIMLGKERKPTIEELVRNMPSPWTDNKAFDMKIGRHQIIVNDDGFIFVESKNKERALQILNLVMACGSFYGFSLHAVRENELVMANYDEHDLRLTNRQWDSETRRAYLLENRYSAKNTNLTRRVRIEPDTIREILSNTEKLLKHEKLAADLRLFNEGLTHFANSEFAQSFIMGWSVVERHYSSHWSALLSTKNIDHDRLSKLINPNQWTIDYVLESLSLQNEIDENSYDLLMDLKSKRNKFYHNGKQIMRDDAERCLKYAMNLLDEKIKQQIRIAGSIILPRRPNAIKLGDS